jgi:predicted N-acyltransferase
MLMPATRPTYDSGDVGLDELFKGRSLEEFISEIEWADEAIKQSQQAVPTVYHAEIEWTPIAGRRWLTVSPF